MENQNEDQEIKKSPSEIKSSKDYSKSQYGSWYEKKKDIENKQEILKKTSPKEIISTKVIVVVGVALLFIIIFILK